MRNLVRRSGAQATVVVLEAEWKVHVRGAVESGLVVSRQFGVADVNQMFLQRFFGTRRHGTLTVTLQSETTANWEVDEDRLTSNQCRVREMSTFGAFPQLPARVRRISSASRHRTLVEVRGASRLFLPRR